MFIPTPARPPTRNKVKAWHSGGTSRQCLSWVTFSSWVVFSGSNQAVLLGRFYCLIICAQLQNVREQICFFCLPFPSANQPSPTLMPHVLMSSLPTSIYLLNSLCPALLSNLPSFFSLSSQSVLSGFTSQISNMICGANILLWPRVWVNIWIGFLPLCVDVSHMCESSTLRPLDIGAQYKTTTKTLSPCDDLAPTDGLMTAVLSPWAFC